MKENDKSPIEILARVSPIASKTYMDQRAAVMENPEAKALPAKIKLLIGIGVASALQSSTCPLMWVKQAHQAGATEAAAEALQWLFVMLHGLRATPSFMSFDVTSTEQEDIQSFLSEVCDLIRRNGLTLVSENKL